MTKQNLFLFHGENTYESSEKLELWKKGFLKKYGEEVQIETFEGKDLDLPNFKTDIRSLPFLCEKRFVVIKNFASTRKTDTLKSLADDLEKIPDFTILVFYETKDVDKRTSFYKKMQKIGLLTHFPAFDMPKTTSWIRETAQKRGLNMSAGEAAFLAQHSGTDLWKLSNEINKLKAFLGQNPVNREAIEHLVKPSLAVSIFNLTDALAQKNARKAIKALEDLSQSGEGLLMIFFMIVRQFRLIITVKDCVEHNLNETQIREKLKLHPFVVKKSMEQSRNFSNEKLAKIYENLLQIEIAQKSGKIKITTTDNSEFMLALEKMILFCCV